MKSVCSFCLLSFISHVAKHTRATFTRIHEDKEHHNFPIIKSWQNFNQASGCNWPWVKPIRFGIDESNIHDKPQTAQFNNISQFIENTLVIYLTPVKSSLFMVIVDIQAIIIQENIQVSMAIAVL